MVRKKVYKKQHILTAAQDLLTEKGFSFITARNVAEHMGISTQPIYLEFKNMEELKLTLLKTTHEFLNTEFFSKKQNSNILANFGLNYIDFAQSNSKLYLSLYIDQHSYGKELQQLSFESFQKTAQENDVYAEVSKEELEKLHMNVWVIATGMASLSLSGILNLSKEQIISAFKTIK
ncbi:hypothetical protein UAY_01623 [Enterococcus moraviensis ATCC BAA-383]|uniref:HTH tetR-type domain-containing protein n=1 Tax=Enterococcus moraviensis ATCC BAA-383 TaxID=1158609 RepID=R2QVK7_9ENTE|nr:TetR/AcrR family transcriptional regulator [Enterococcus moraviensis]EOI00520.1 hypothetical protein UAY_01623 [Enterococcus moraviensis ATCC BAA-383]EOT73251.1 hypothetical protein I586_00244 [Enterococcus moraviensis ATCC BAA-383]OJG68807.1 hypothetical protein RV09_GL000206 [Enterococcus moraviensis]